MFKKNFNEVINQMIIKEWEYQSQTIMLFASMGIGMINKDTVYEEKCKLSVAFSDLRIDFLKSVRNSETFLEFLFISPVIAWFRLHDWLYREN